MTQPIREPEYAGQLERVLREIQASAILLTEDVMRRPAVLVELTTAVSSLQTQCVKLLDMDLNFEDETTTFVDLRDPDKVNVFQLDIDVPNSPEGLT